MQTQPAYFEERHRAVRLIAPASPCADREAGTLFPAIPTLLATQLQLEMLLADRSVDLRKAAGIIQNDLGATLEIFRRAGEESGPHSRLEDCLASLGTDVWMETLCAHALERSAQNSGKLGELTAFWEHGRQLAYACWLLAEQSEVLCPEEAYLVGLLHECARLPFLLDWEAPRTGENAPARMAWPDVSGMSLAEHWQLPAYLQSLISAANPPACWRDLLRTAHVWSCDESTLKYPA